MKYHKIDSVFKRDPETNNKRFIMGAYSRPEFAYLKDAAWVGTEKVDGTNIRLTHHSLQGKTDNAQIHQGLFAHLLTVQEKLRNSDLPTDILLYGEGYGAKIQSGGQYIPDGQSFVLFDVVINGNFQSRYDVLDIATKLNIPSVPILGAKTLEAWVEAISQGQYIKSLLHPSAKNEGVVLRPLYELKTRVGDRIITKLKFKDFGI
jgi:hypothetical protein